MDRGNCEFRGSGGQYFPTVFIHLMILGTITFGIYIPWALCRLWRLKASHTRINGKDVAFTGQGGDLFVLCLVQGLITLVTLGIYTPWAVARVLRWKMENTLVSGKPSVFNGTGGSLFLLYLIHLVILPILTLGIYYLWGMYRFYAWKEENSLYGGEKTSFGAGLGRFVKISILSWILNTVTLQLFTPWSICWLYRWQIEGLRVGPEPEVEHYPPVKTNILVVVLLVVIGLAAMYGLVNVIKNQAMMALFVMNQLAQTNKAKTLKMAPGRIRSIPPLKSVPKKAKPGVSTMPKPRKEHGLVTKRQVQDVGYAKRIEALLEFSRKYYGTPEAYYNRGLAYYLMGRLDRAIKEYTRAIRRNNKDADPYYNRALAYINKGDYERAVRDLAITIRLDPDSADAYCNRAGANFRLGRFDEALADYNAAIKVSPNDADLYHNRALVYKARGQSEQARADLDRERSLRPALRPVTRGGSPVPGRAKWREKLDGVTIPEENAYGMIHGQRFQLQDAILDNGILTLRQGKNFFADREIKIFTFKSSNESLYGAHFEASTDKKYGVPHVHLSWMEKGKNLPKIKIYSGGYAMVLQFGQRQGDVLPGSIYVCLPDEHQSYVAGRFWAKLGKVKNKH